MSFLRFLWSALGRSRSVFVGAMAMSVLDGLTAAVPPLLAGLVLARLMQPDLTAAALIPYGGGIVLAVVIRMIIVRPVWIWGFAAGNAATEAIRNRLLDHMRRTPLGIYQRWTPSERSPRIDAALRCLAEVLLCPAGSAGTALRCELTSEAASSAE